MDKFFVKQTYVFDESLFKTGYPYKLQCDEIDEPSYELFIEIDRVTGNAIFRRYDGIQHAVHVQDYLDGKLTITGPLTITFDDCAISIDDIKPESFINTELKTDTEKDSVLKGHRLTDTERNIVDMAEEDRASQTIFNEVINEIKPQEKVECLMKLKKAVEDCKQATGVVKETKHILDEINGYPHAFITVNTDSTSPYTISDGHTPLTNELEDIMRNDDNNEEDHTNEG